jgi:predicted nucleic acid-binding protein
LLSAKEKGLLTRVGPLIDELRESGYWLSDEVVEAARKLADE